jgi:hypothetical protein
VAHRVDQEWNIRTLETTDGTPVVWREQPGAYRDISSGTVLKAKRPVIVLTGYASWSVVYAWTGRDIAKVQVTD